ncbi:signal peptidase I [Bacillus velezensis]
MKKTLKLISNILYAVIFSLIIVLTLTVISTRASGGEPAIFGYTLKSVLSGSMDPEFKTGSLIAVKKISDVNDLEKGDVITFTQDDGTAVTHRIIGITKKDGNLLFETKGTIMPPRMPHPFKLKKWRPSIRDISFRMPDMSSIWPASRSERRFC